MKNKKLYKYINLLFRITIAVFAVWFIYFKIKDNFILNFHQIVTKDINFTLLWTAILLMFLNWGTEAVKWRYSIKKIQKISITKAIQCTVTSITMGLITPNRIGEIPSRAILLNRNLFKELTLKTMVASFSQMLITLLFGAIGLLITNKYFNIEIDTSILIAGFTFIILFTFLVYFKVSKLAKLLHSVNYFREREIFKALSDFSYQELVNLLLFSFLRYFIFTVQFYLVLTAFGVSLNSFNNIMLIPVCFMFASFIPTILISEIGVRGAVAVIVFGTISNFELEIIIASILLWMINVALPALIGIVNLKGINILKNN